MKTPLSDPQIRLLAAIGRYGCLSAFQLNRLLYGSALSWVRPNLRSLLSQQLLRIRPYNRFLDRQGGKPLDLFVLTQRGRTHLTRLGVAPVYMPALKRHDALAHTVACNDLVILAHRLSRTTPYVVVDFRVEFDLKRQPVTVGSYILVPDAYTYVTDEESHWPIVWELDRSTEGKRMLARKLEALAHYVNGAYREVFSVDSITVAFVADTPQRAHRLRAWTEEVLTTLKAEVLAPNFLFASFKTGDVKPEDVFLTPIWRTPFSTQPVVLLEE